MPSLKPPQPLRWRLVVLGSGHLTMLIMMHILLQTYQPEPNGFRLNTVSKTVGFAVFTSVPIWFGLSTRTRIGTSLIGLLQALSPLALVGTMRDPRSDLDFAILLWWFPMPTVTALVMIIDNVTGSRRRGLQQTPPPVSDGVR